MKTARTAHEKEQRRRLAVLRVKEGWSTSEVASFLEVDIRSVQRWVKADREGGPAGLAAKPYAGHPKLTPQQAATVIEWLTHSPREFGFLTELWTGKRVAFLIQQRLGVVFHPHYVNEWLTQRKITPQKPQRVPRERNQQKINEWLAQDLPRIQEKKRHGSPSRIH